MYSILLAVAALAAQSARPTHRPDVPGCYRADRALGTSANSALGRSVPGPVGHAIGEDSAGLAGLQTFQLREHGRVERPDVTGPQWWARGSDWTEAGDTLRVTLSTQTSGWRLQLVRVAGIDDAYVGTARYLTDVIVKDGSGPLELPVKVTRVSCSSVEQSRGRE